MMTTDKNDITYRVEDYDAAAYLADMRPKVEEALVWMVTTYPSQFTATVPSQSWRAARAIEFINSIPLHSRVSAFGHNWSKVCEVRHLLGDFLSIHRAVVLLSQRAHDRKVAAEA